MTVGAFDNGPGHRRHGIAGALLAWLWPNPLRRRDRAAWPLLPALLGWMWPSAIGDERFGRRHGLMATLFGWMWPTGADHSFKRFWRTSWLWSWAWPGRVLGPDGEICALAPWHPAVRPEFCPGEPWHRRLHRHGPVLFMMFSAIAIAAPSFMEGNGALDGGRLNLFRSGGNQGSGAAATGGGSTGQAGGPQGPDGQPVPTSTSDGATGARGGDGNPGNPAGPGEPSITNGGQDPAPGGNPPSPGNSQSPGDGPTFLDPNPAGDDDFRPVDGVMPGGGSGPGGSGTGGGGGPGGGGAGGGDTGVGGGDGGNATGPSIPGVDPFPPPPVIPPVVPGDNGPFPGGGAGGNGGSGGDHGGDEGGGSLTPPTILPGDPAGGPKDGGIGETKPIDPPREVGAIPEPSTWIMMILGFGAAGHAIRRRRAVSRVG